MERTASWIVAKPMKLRRKSGMGRRRRSEKKTVAFRKAMVNSLCRLIKPEN